MEIIYKADPYSPYIEKLEVYKETDRCYYLKHGERIYKRKADTTDRFFDLFEDARDYAITQTELRVSRAQAEVARERSTLNKLFALQESEITVK